MSYDEAMGKHRRVTGIEYVEAYDLAKLRTEVKAWIARGFEPLGPVGRTKDDDLGWLQTMVTYHGN